MLSDHNILKLEINNIRKFGKSTNICKLNNTLVNNFGQRRNHKRNHNIFQLYKNEKKISLVQLKQCTQGFITLNAHIRKEEKSQINNASFHHKKVRGKKEQRDPQVSKRNNIINIRMEINTNQKNYGEKANKTNIGSLKISTKLLHY